jgi:hypothetical protein
MKLGILTTHGNQKDWRRGRESTRPLKTKAKPLVLPIGAEFPQLYCGLFSAI